MKNKKIYLVFPIILGIIIACVLLIIQNSGDDGKIAKGNRIFGRDYCTGHDLTEISGAAMTPWNCQICGKESISSTTSTPELCHECAQITGRCSRCGKLK